MDVVLTYDIEKIESVHKFVKDCLEQKGYFDAFIKAQTSRIVHLPNTTMIKKDHTPGEAYDDLVDCLNKFEKKHKVRPELEKVFADEITSRWCGKAKDATKEELNKYPAI